MYLLRVMIVMLLGINTAAQQGIITGFVMDEKNKALENVTVQLLPFTDTTKVTTVQTNATGSFTISEIALGYYKLKFSYVSLQSQLIDSIYFRPDRFDFNLNEIILKVKSTGSLDEIIIYAEKPLIQSKDGNITFNAGESALSQGSNASDLLTQVPLVTKDPNGKVLVRGKEPRILIDDKPVELNLQQLQDLLESMPGSSIEKIELMTNPPPQYANEQGGVINIVTRRGAVGVNGRLSMFAGSRGEIGGNGSFSYRKNGLAVNLNAGLVNNVFEGEGYSSRQNLYADSSNFFKTDNVYQNKNLRPTIRLNIDQEFTKAHLLNLVFHYNQNSFDNDNVTFFRNINRFSQTFRLSNRNIGSTGDNFNTAINVNYTYKTKVAGESFKLFSSYNFSNNSNDRLFYQQFLQPDYTFTGNDSLQNQLNENISDGYTVRLAYDRPLANKKTFLSAGTFYTKSYSDVATDATFKRKTDGAILPLDLLSNYFLFKQSVTNLRGSIKQLLGPNFSTTAGLSAEKTAIHFDLLKTGKDTSNAYWTLLPFMNLNKSWANHLNITFSYKRTLRRPGINELNPTRDFSDPYNIRAGNPALAASSAHNFDFVAGRSINAFYLNVGMGYNIVDDIFNPIRNLLPDGTTEIIWQNISGKKEYEVSTWSGYTFKNKMRLNVSASYTYNVYSDYDKSFRKYRDGGSLTSTINTNYTIKSLYTASGNFTFNSFANPQGKVRNNLSMNLGLQAKLPGKKFVVTLNIIDPFTQQQNRTFTYGNNFILENFNSTQTRNYRLSVGYSFSKAIKKMGVKPKLPQLNK